MRNMLRTDHKQSRDRYCLSRLKPLLQGGRYIRLPPSHFIHRQCGWNARKHVDKCLHALLSGRVKRLGQ